MRSEPGKQIRAPGGRRGPTGQRPVADCPQCTSHHEELQRSVDEYALLGADAELPSATRRAAAAEAIPLRAGPQALPPAIA